MHLCTESVANVSFASVSNVEKSDGKKFQPFHFSFQDNFLFSSLCRNESRYKLTKFRFGVRLILLDLTLYV